MAEHEGPWPARHPGGQCMTTWMPNLSRRRRLPELIDQPDLDPGRHAHALQGLERINLFSRSASILWPPLYDLARELAPRPVRLLDVATGAGDLPIRLWHRARRAGVRLEAAGCDQSPAAVGYACRRAARAAAEVPFFTWDALGAELPPGEYDVVACSLFLHHLDDDQAVELLRRMAQLARRLVLVNDLVRSVPGYLLAYVGTRVLTSCDVVHQDGPQSVEGAYTLAEAEALARRAGLDGAQVARRWPCRFLLSWSRP